MLLARLCAAISILPQYALRSLQETLFSEYRIQSNANNVISMEVATGLLCHALKAAQSSSKVTLRLAKKDQHGVLLFDIEATV
jgi:hypothetical protein